MDSIFFADAWYYNLEEVIGHSSDSAESYCTVLREMLLNHVGVASNRMPMPSGLEKIPPWNVSALTII